MRNADRHERGRRQRGRQHLRRAVVALAVVSAGCSAEVHADCEIAGPGVTTQVQRLASSASDTIYATPSRTSDDVFFLSAQTSKGVAVWASMGDPRTGGSGGLVLAMNPAAEADALIDVGTDGGASVSVATLSKDTEGIAVAIACVK